MRLRSYLALFLLATACETDLRRFENVACNDIPAGYCATEAPRCRAFCQGARSRSCACVSSADADCATCPDSCVPFVGDDYGYTTGEGACRAALPPSVVTR